MRVGMVTRAVASTVHIAVLATLAAFVTGCSSDEPSRSADQVTTIGVRTGGPQTSSASAPTTPPTVADSADAVAKRTLIEWQRRIDGKNLSYEAAFSCGICAVAGKWRVSERDGEIVEAIYLGAGEMEAGLQPITLTSAIAAARSATGHVSIVESTSVALHVTYDSDTNAIDDEVDYQVTDLIIK